MDSFGQPGPALWLVLALAGCDGGPVDEVDTGADATDTDADTDTDTDADADTDTDTDTDTDADTDTGTDTDTDTGTASAWTIEVAAAGVGRYTSLAVASGEPRIAWEAIDIDSDLHLAARSGGVWSDETVDDGIYAGEFPDQIVDTDGRSVVSYGVYGDLAVTAGTPGGGWTLETLRPGARGATSVVIDADGTRLYTHTNSVGDFEYTSGDGSTYDVIDRDTTGASSYGRMVQDGAGALHVAYEDGDFLAADYATFDGTDWNVTEVASVGSDVALALDAADSPVVAYDDWLGGHICVATWTGARFAVTEVASVGTGVTGVAVAVDDLGRVQVAWHAADDGIVFWAVDDGGTWVVEPLDDAGADGGYPDLVVVGTAPWVSYSGPSGAMLATRAAY